MSRLSRLKSVLDALASARKCLRDLIEGQRSQIDLLAQGLASLEGRRGNVHGLQQEALAPGAPGGGAPAGRIQSRFGKYKRPGDSRNQDVAGEQQRAVGLSLKVASGSPVVYSWGPGNRC